MQQALVAQVGRCVLRHETVFRVDLAAQVVRHVLPQRAGVLDLPQRRRVDPEQASVRVGDGVLHRLLPGLDARGQQVGAAPQADLFGQRRRQRLLGLLQSRDDRVHARTQRGRRAVGRHALPGQVPVGAPQGELGGVLRIRCDQALHVGAPARVLARIEFPVPLHAFQPQHRQRAQLAIGEQAVLVRHRLLDGFQPGHETAQRIGARRAQRHFLRIALVGIGAPGNVGQRDGFGGLGLGRRQQRGDVLRMRARTDQQHQAGKAGQQHTHDGRSRNRGTARV